MFRGTYPALRARNIGIEHSKTRPTENFAHSLRLEYTIAGISKVLKRNIGSPSEKTMQVENTNIFDTNIDSESFILR